jgi:hypothetical protein
MIVYSRLNVVRAMIAERLKRIKGLLRFIGGSARQSKN